MEPNKIEDLVFQKEDGTYDFYDEAGLPYNGYAYKTFDEALNALRAYMVSLNATKHVTK